MQYNNIPRKICRLYTSNTFRIRDPIHSYISFDRRKFEFLINVIDSFEFQRLRRIKQLGTTYFVYPGAEHSRFGHSIGTMWLMYQFVNEFKDNGINVEEDFMSKMLLAALIHDIGHGPYSHVFERITKYDHKEMTSRFIKERLPEIVPTFSANEIMKLLKRDLDPGNIWVCDLLNSQIDVDRMDFLLRDSLYTGVDYGRFDMQRVFHSLAVGEVNKENHLIMLLKGLHAFEGFFIAYHHMYWQVYFHKTTRAYEILLNKIFDRMKELLLEKGLDIDIQPELESLLTTNKVNLQEFFLLDDCTVLEAVKKCRFSSDNILKDLCNRFLNRRIFKCIKMKEVNVIDLYKRCQEFYEKEEVPFDYYFETDELHKISVKRPTLEDGILMADLDKSGEIDGPFDFIDESDIIRSLYNIKRTEFRMYCPEYLKKDLKEFLSNG